MKIGALQSAYLPWLGFFDQIEQCDLFVIYDDLQYTKKDWRNRNRIKTADGVMWLTVPVITKGCRQKRICDIEISYQANWPRKHWKAIEHSYSRAHYYGRHADFFNALYKSKPKYLSQLNREIIDYCLAQLGIRTQVLYSHEAEIENGFLSLGNKRIDPTERIVYLCKRFGAQSFLEGSAGRNYINEEMLREADIMLEYHDYSHPIYRQLYDEFVPYLSIIDLLFNQGPNSLSILSNSHLN